LPTPVLLFLSSPRAWAIFALVLSFSLFKFKFELLFILVFCSLSLNYCLP
jgi:hypothetical protein